MNFNENEFENIKTAKSDGVSTMPTTENCRAIVLAGKNDFSSAGGLIPIGLRGQRPKHFCRTPGSEIVINTARKQIENFFAPEDVMFVVTEEHERYYEEVLPDVKAENLIIQPQDDGTTFAVLYAALRMAITDPSAILAFFPPDFQPPNADEFMRRVESACAFARRDPNLILLGIKPAESKNPDELIELDSSAPVDKNFGVWRVRRFIAKASPAQKREFKNNGALSNSSVMIGTPATFLRKIRRAAPEIFDKFRLAAERIGTTTEQKAVRAAYYSQYAYTNFSRDVLEKSAEKLLVAPVPATLKSAIGIEPPAIEGFSERILTRDAPKFYAAGFSI